MLDSHYSQDLCAKDKVKYWLTFNEINSVLQEPLLSGGIWTAKERLSVGDKLQAIHHELVASSLVTKKIGRWISPEFRIGCMVLALPVYLTFKFAARIHRRSIAG